MLGPEDHKAHLENDARNIGDTSSTVIKDIAVLTAEMRSGTFANQSGVSNMEYVHWLIRAMGFSVLGRLAEMGVQEAATLEEKLEAVDSKKQPLVSDLHSLSFAFEDERLKADDPARQHELDGLAALSRAAGVIAIVHTHAVTNRSDTAHIDMLKEDARDNVVAALPKVSEDARIALGILVAEMDAGTFPQA